MSEAPAADSNPKTDHKPKRLVIFCDGTWNRENQKTPDGRPCPTNVLRMFEATAPKDSQERTQNTHYIRGVGNRWDEKLLGGVGGYGISDNVKNAYQFLVSNYEPRDEIFLLGFSRGAFTARSLAGLIYNVGILKRENLHLIDEAYKRYRARSADWHPDSVNSKLYKF